MRPTKEAISGSASPVTRSLASPDHASRKPADAGKKRSGADRFVLRRERLRRLLKSKSIPALLVSDSANVHYLTGFGGEDSWLLIIADRAVLLSDSRFTEQIAIECPGLEADIRRPGKGRKLTDQAADLAGRFKLAGLGFERSHLAVAAYEAIRAKCKSTELVGVDGVVESLRVIKDRGEVDAIRAAVESAEQAYGVVRSALQATYSEKEVADRIDAEVRRFSAQDSAFETIVAVGDRAALPHARPGNRRLATSPLVLIDWGARRDHYHSDLTRTLFLGKPTAKFARVYDVVRKAQQAAIDAIAPGAAARDIDRAARIVIEAAGFGRYFGHSIGHGLGLRIHEDPGLRADNPSSLRPGMVVTVEPGIYLKGWGGIRIEDDVLVTRSGRQVLTSVPKQFDEIIIQSW